ncbi:MAG: efflux RND transporter periplasmic adaptor subunit [Syntrophus sp. (in: bacteria)]
MHIGPQNSLLTYVSQIDPIWINFSLSENDILKSRRQEKQGIIRLPEDQAFSVEVVLADGITFPGRGKIFFADAEYNQQTGTFLVRSTLPNPGNILRPGQFVRVRILGIVRPNAIIVPQRAVQQGAKGHFVWVVDKQNKANYRPVVVGDWNGNDWFINEGLQAGDQVVVDGGLALRPDQPVQAKVVTPESTTAPAAPPKAKTETKGGAKGRN